VMVALHPPNMVTVPLQEAAEKTKPVPLDSDSIVTARDMGSASAMTERRRDPAVKQQGGEQ